LNSFQKPVNRIFLAIISSPIVIKIVFIFLISYSIWHTSSIVKQHFMKKIHKLALHIYFVIRNTKPVWNFLNRKARLLFFKNKPQLNSEQQRISEELRRTGISVSSLDALFPGQNLLETLNAYAQSLNADEAEQGKKKFLKKYWDRNPIFSLENPFVSFLLSPAIIDVVNTYMGLFTKLKYYDLALTIPVPPEAKAVQSQRWHRDPEEKKICKVFIYLNDVDETTGPFIYVLESNADGKFGKLFPQKTPEGIYPAEGAVEKAIPAQNIKKMTGKAGTVIFCDTSGIHKGGYATAKERLMFTGFFTSTSYTEKPYYSFEPSFSLENSSLSTPAQFALQLN